MYVAYYLSIQTQPLPPYSLTMVHVPFRWGPIGEYLDHGDLSEFLIDPFVSQLEAELQEIFERDDIDMANDAMHSPINLGEWLDTWLDQIEATIDDNNMFIAFPLAEEDL